MSDIAISVQNLSKRYRIGKIETQTTKRGSITRRIASPFQYLYSTLRQPDPDEVIWALKDVSFEVKHGEVLGVIGRNGAGKTTLLKILSRITEPTSGRAVLNGRVGSLLEVGTGFHPELTGRENIYLSGAILGMKKAEIDRKLDEIIDFSGVEKFIDTPVKRYSSGMRVRLAFAVAAHLEPEILLIDEVLAVGDAEFQKKCLGKMGDVAKEGRTVLFISHNLNAIKRLCPNTIMLDEGVVTLIGESNIVVEKYLESNLIRKAIVKLMPDCSKRMRLREISIFNKFGIPSTRIDIGEPFRIKIIYDVNEKINGAHIICLFYTDDGVNIFGTGDADASPERFSERNPGNYCGEFEVPAFLLGEGKYYITVSLGIPFIHVYDRHEEIYSFEIIDNSSRRRQWQHRRRPGILGIELSWHYDVEPIKKI